MLGLLVVSMVTAFAGDVPRAATLLPVDEAPRRNDALDARRLELESSRPRLLRPIALTAGGAGGVLLGLGAVWSGFLVGYWYAFSAAALGVVLVVAGIAVAAAGAVVMVFGIVSWVRTVRARRLVDAQLEELDARAAAERGPAMLVLARW